MEVKYENLVDKYKETLRKISVDAEAWKSFLESASYTYMQPFQNQVVLHFYRPGVKAVATKQAWQKLNRSVASDAQGLPVLNEDNSVGRVFDYQDTRTVGNAGILPWTVHKNKSGIALHNLLKRTGEKSLSDYVHKRVTAVLISDAKQSAPPELQECLEQSVQYVLQSRLGLEVDNLDTSGFAFASAYQNRPAALERLGHLLTKSLRQCLMPLRAVAYKMDMTMPAPEPQIKAPAVSSEPLTEVPREWGYYLIPDLKTWATNSSERTPIEHYETFEEVRERFAALRDQSYNKSNDLNDDGQPYAHLTLGLESKDTLSSVDILQVRAGQNYLVEDFTRMERLKNDPSFLETLSQVAKEIGFDRVRPYALEAGSYKAPATPSIETSEKTKESTAPEQVQPQPIPQKTAVEIPINGKWTKFQTVADAEQAAYEEYKANIARNAQNYKALPDEQTEPGGPKARFQDNINALRLLQHLETTGMQATPEQQQLLARYVGWGGLADAFDARKDNWHKEYQELKELLPEAEYEAARASTLTSYYTSPEIVRAMYSTLERFGLQGGNILEPSMGVGAFFANRPASFDESAHLFGVEIDPVTGRIAKQLYPKANIQICGYEKATLPDSYFDAVIGNVPFGQYKVNDPAFNRYNFLIHDYFAAKSIDKLRVGGIQAIITTSGTMDKQTEDVRKYLAARCELIGAVRLPNTAFKALAGTEVTADILFLQKREHILDQDVSWLHTGTNADGIPMNQYFIDHPEMICGKMEMVSGPYGMRPTCQPDTSTTLEEQLQAAMGRLNATLVKTEPIILEQPGEISPLPADPDIRNYSYGIRDDKIFFRTDSVMREVTANATAQARIRGMVSILATTRELIQAQLDDLPDEAVAQLQHRLNHEYDAFTEKYGRLNSRANALAFRDDSGYSLLCSLENFDDEHNFKSKSDMFTKKTIRPNRVIDHVETASEALMLSVQEHTSVDLHYMEQLTGKTRDELLQDLTGVVFRVPGETTAAGEPLYQTAEEYLSGDVRKKLAVAEIFAKQDPSYQVNADSLKTVQPKDLAASEIELHLGTTWIPPEDIKQFILETMEPNRWAAQSIKVSYNRLNATWNIEGSSVDSYNLKATTTFGTKRKNFYEILRCSLNLQAVKVVDYIEDVDGKKKAVPNVKETRLAQDKQQQIEAAFKDWIYRDPDRRRRLVDYYNTHYNNLRPREYDGSFLRFPGMNPEISLRPHQRNAVARILFGGNTLVLCPLCGTGADKRTVSGSTN